MALVIKNLPANAGDTRGVGLIPGLRRSLGVENGNPFQYSCLENPMDRGAWRATVHGAAKSQISLSTHTHNLLLRENILIIVLAAICIWQQESKYLSFILPMILNMTLGLLISLIFIDYILQQIYFSYVNNIHKYEKCRILTLSVKYVWNYFVFGMNLLIWSLDYQTLYSVLEHFFKLKII